MWKESHRNGKRRDGKRQAGRNRFDQDALPVNTVRERARGNRETNEMVFTSSFMLLHSSVRQIHMGGFRQQPDD